MLPLYCNLRYIWVEPMRNFSVSNNCYLYNIKNKTDVSMISTSKSRESFLLHNTSTYTWVHWLLWVAFINFDYLKKTKQKQLNNKCLLFSPLSMVGMEWEAFKIKRWHEDGNPRIPSFIFLQEHLLARFQGNSKN